MKKTLVVVAAMLSLCITEGRATDLDSIGRDTKYVQTILSRSAKVTDALSITGTDKGNEVLHIVANRYFKLNDIYAERDSLKAAAKALTGDAKKQKTDFAEMQKDQKLYKSHYGFIAELSLYLTDEEIEKVKDVMTFNVVKVTYDAQCDMIPTLKDEEKSKFLHG